MSISVSDELQLFAKELYGRESKYEENETVASRICISFFGNAIILYLISFTFHPLFITISKTCIMQKSRNSS